MASIAEQQHRLAVMQVGVVDFHRVEIVTLGDDEVLPAIVVVIEESRAPTGMLHSEAAETAAEAGIREAGISVVLI